MKVSAPNLAPWLLIPARLGSTRLPRKALIELDGLPMVARVAARARRCKAIGRCVVVTDAQEIADVVRLHGGEALISERPCESGSERVVRGAERLIAAGAAAPDWIINLQGDEAFIEPALLDQVCVALPAAAKRGAEILTLAAPLPEQPGPGCVRVKVNAEGRASSFSRAPISDLHHVGLYAFHRNALHYPCLPRSPLACQENLEQLTWLDAGALIDVLCLDTPQYRAIDTAEDLKWAKAQLSKRFI